MAKQISLVFSVNHFTNPLEHNKMKPKILKSDQVKLDRFFHKISIEIKNNMHKSDGVFQWTDFNEMITELEYHKAKMMMAIRTGDHIATSEFIADTVAVLFAIGNLGGIYDKEITNTDVMTCAQTDIFIQLPLDTSDGRDVKTLDELYKKQPKKRYQRNMSNY